MGKVTVLGKDALFREVHGHHERWMGAGQPMHIVDYRDGVVPRVGSRNLCVTDDKGRIQMQSEVQFPLVGLISQVLYTYANKGSMWQLRMSLG